MLVMPGIPRLVVHAEDEKARRAYELQFRHVAKDLLPPVDPDRGNPPPPDNRRSVSFAEENGMYPDCNTSSTFVLSVPARPSESPRLF
jgi:hypothetical protein